MNMLCYEDAFSQFNTKPAVPLCINCGKPWLQGADGCQEASGGLGPCSTNNKQKSVLELYSLEFIMELDAFHYKTTDTDMTEMLFCPYILILMSATTVASTEITLKNISVWQRLVRCTM